MIWQNFPKFFSRAARAENAGAEGKPGLAIFRHFLYNIPDNDMLQNRGYTVSKPKAAARRAAARETALHLIYEMNFHEFETDEDILERLDAGARSSLAEEVGLYAAPLDGRQTNYILQVVKGVAARREALDAQIVRSAKGWSLNRITRLSRAVLRLALYEMAFVDDVPVGAAINEAVELAKKYDSDEAGGFVNGILGKLGRELTRGDALFDEPEIIGQAEEPAESDAQSAEPSAQSVEPDAHGAEPSVQSVEPDAQSAESAASQNADA